MTCYQKPYRYCRIEMRHRYPAKCVYHQGDCNRGTQCNKPQSKHSFILCVKHYRACGKNYEDKSSDKLGKKLLLVKRQLGCYSRVLQSSFIFSSMLFRICRTFSIVFDFGSSISQSRYLFKKTAGHSVLFMHPILILRTELRIISSDNSFGRCLLISIPTSFIASTARGLISGVGLVPALIGVHPFGAYFLKNPSAIWLRPAFSTQTNKTFFSGFGFPNNFMNVYINLD